MAKKQTRRAISVRGLTYQRLAAYCEANDLTVSGFLEEIIHERMDAVGQTRETILRGRPTSTKRKFKPNAANPKGFTF